ncbi:MAG: copper resistance CopC/CopD family protein [Acidimicrobiales bacterium]
MSAPGHSRHAESIGRQRRWRRRVAVGFGAWLIAVVLLGTVGAGVASAHAFLVGSDPPQGARLARAPSTITLVFSEAVVTSATTVTIRLAGTGRRVPASVEHARDTNTVRVRLGATPTGVYVVSWQDLSAEDGHAALGEFAFAAGVVAGTLPATHQAGTSPDPVRVAATVLFLAGLSLAAGGAVTGLVVDPTITVRSAGIRIGSIAATVGAVVAFVDDIAGQSTGLSHAGLLAGIAALLAAAASFIAGVVRRLVPVLVALVAAGVVWAADGHPALVGGALGLVVNAVHLVVGAVWVGTLVYLLADLVRYRGDRERLLRVAARYARLALPLVIVLAGAGGISALEALPSWSSLYTSGYGQLILVKTGLFALALGLASWSRRRGIGRGQTSALALAVPVEAGVVAVILVVTALLANTGPPVEPRPLATLLGPAPLTGPVARTAGLAGELNVALAAGSGQFRVQVYDPEQSTISARVDIEALYPDGKDAGLFPRPCGNGCFTQTLNLPDGITHVHVTAAAAGWPGGTWDARIDWPPPADAPALLSRLVATMDTVPDVAVRETVTSNSATPSFARVLGPISGRQLMALEVYGASGDSGEGASSITDVQPLTTGGPGLQIYLPGTPVWATLWLDNHGRLARDRIVSLGHLITDTFTYPDLPTPQG